MGRSGTSLCCQALRRFGYGFGETLGPSPGNEIGYYENVRLVRLQREMTMSMFSIGGWLFDDALPDGWSADERVATYVDRAVEIIRYQDLNAFKDPLATRIYPFWRLVFKRMDVKPTIINCLREKQQVYGSMVHEGVAFNEHSCVARRRVQKLWAEFVVAAERVRPDLDLWFEDWFTDPERQMVKLGGVLRRIPPPSVDGLIHPELRHDREKIPL